MDLLRQRADLPDRVGSGLAWAAAIPTARGQATPPDIRGIVLLSPGVALILYGLAQVSRDGGVRRREVLIPSAAAPLGARREQRDADHAAGRRVVRDRGALAGGSFGDPGRMLLR